MSQHKNGTVDSAKTVKAGCGIRYDPDVLGEHSGFDFSNAKNLKPEPLQETEMDQSAEQANKAHKVR